MSFREVEGEGEKWKVHSVISKGNVLLLLFHSGGQQRAGFPPRAVAVQIWTQTTKDWQVRTYGTKSRWRRNRTGRGRCRKVVSPSIFKYLFLTRV